MKKFVPIACLCLLLGCGKSDDIAPVITLTTPAENQVFTGGQTVTVKATITDNEGIHMVHFSVTDLSTGGHAAHLEEHLDSKSYSLNQAFATAAGRSYKIEIEAVDHNDNVTSKELTVSAN
jgi:hypothetical protein